MTVGSTLGGFNRDWFTLQGGYAILKSECVSQFREAVKAKAQEQRLELKQFMADAKKRGTSVRLTDEQLEHLSASYDPRNMTREEYQAFVDDLCGYGVLNEADKDWISYGILTPVTFLPELSCTGTAAAYKPYDSSFLSSGGNVLDWSKYLSTFEYVNPDTGSWEKTRSAILFERIQNVLVRMGA